MARTIIVDPSPLFCEGMRNWLGKGGHVVLGEPRNLEEALQRLDALHPDLVLLGPNLAEHESLAVCREIICRWPTVKTIIITPHADGHLFRADAIYAGAAACLRQDISHEECLAAVAAVMAGQSLFLHKELFHGHQPIRLTPREREVLRLLAEEKRDKEIADVLMVKGTTIHNHVQRILEKLEVHNRQEAVRRARRRGWPI